MTTKPKTVPELRFPGFEGEWTKRELAEIAKIERGRFSPRPRNNPIYYGGDIPFVQTSDVVNAKGRISKFTQTLNEKGLKVSKRFPQGTILITIAANIGHTAVLEIPMACPDSLVGISCDEATHNFFLNFLLEREQPTMDYLAVEAAQKNINIAFLEIYPLTLPPALPEQRKIADFLTAVDGRIGQLSQKKALLEDYKKGVMQQLFTQALRFKDDHGNDFPEWEEKKYSEIYTFQNTNSFSRDLLTYEGGEVRNIHYGDIHTKFRSNFYLSKEVVPFIKPEVELKRIAKDCYCRVGDLVIADASEDYADVGKCIEIMELGEKTLAGLHTFIARPRKGAISPGFGGYLMQSWEVRLKIMTIAQGTKVLGLSKNMLCNIKLPIPHPDEQTKIANFLTALDRKIESVSSQITHTQTFKKGLLQQMFV